MFSRLFLLVVLISVSAAVGCEAQKTSGDSRSIADPRFRVETVATGLQVPWAFAWLPNGTMLVTERPGRVRIIEKDQLRAEPAFVVPDVEPSSESGLMDITLHPDFAKNGFVYLAYAYNNDGKRIKVMRYRYVDGKFMEP